MDSFNVPKEVNQLVYKTVFELQESLAGFVPAELINRHVKSSLLMVNVDEIIYQSLSNLTDLGILARTGSSSYAIRHTIKCAKIKYTGIPTCDLDSRVSNKRSSSARKTSVNRDKRVSKSKAKRSKAKPSRDRAPIKRSMRKYIRTNSSICFHSRTSIALLPMVNPLEYDCHITKTVR